MSKKTLYVIIISVVVLILALIALTKAGVIGNTKKGKEIEVAQVQEITIVETVSATGKIQPETEIKISSEVSGEIIEFNEGLESNPEAVNKDPYGDGWMIKVKLSNPSEMDGLLDAAGYQALVG